MTLNEFFFCFANSGGSAMVVSWVLELIPWYQKQEANIKKYIYAALTAVVAILGYLGVTYLPAQLIADLTPLFSILYGVFTSMVKLAKMIEAHLQGILAHWRSGVTNAFMEGLNSVFSAVKRKARGFRSSTYLITMLYLAAGKLRLPQI